MPDLHGKDNMDEATTHTNQMGEIVRTTQKSPSGLIVGSVHKSQVSDPATADDYELVRVAGVGPTAEIPTEEFVDRYEQSVEEDLHEMDREEVQGVDLDDDEDEAHDAESAPDATESAKALADDEDVDLSKVEGSGKDGRVTKHDVEKHLEEDERPVANPDPENDKDEVSHDVEILGGEVQVKGGDE